MRTIFGEQEKLTTVIEHGITLGANDYGFNIDPVLVRYITSSIRRQLGRHYTTGTIGHTPIMFVPVGDDRELENYEETWGVAA